MKRTLLLLLAAALLPALGASAFSLVKSDKEKEELKGQVKTVKEYNLRKAEYFHADTVAKYRRHGKPLPKYERTLRNIYTYDVKGRKTVKEDPILERKTVNSYNPNIRNCMLAEVSDTYFKGELSRRYAFNIGADGIPVSAKATDGSGKTIFTETFTATRDGDKTNVRCEHVNADGSVTMQNLVLRPDHSISSLTIEEGQKKQKFKFNEDELPVEISIESPYQTIHQVIVLSPDKQVSYAVTPDGSHKLVRQALLDKNGNPYEIDRYDDNGNLVEITSFIYKYDNQGNWIKRSKFVNSNSASEIIEREITYY